MPLDRRTPVGTTWCFQVMANEPNCLVVFLEWPDSNILGGEITFRWSEVDGEMVPRLECWDDAWVTLASSGLTWLLAEWAGHAVPLVDFVAALRGYGFADRSMVPNPREHAGRAAKSNPADARHLSDEQIAAVMAAYAAIVTTNHAELAVAGLDGQGEVIDAEIVQEVLEAAADLEEIHTGDIDADSYRRLTTAVAEYRQALAANACTSPDRSAQRPV